MTRPILYSFRRCPYAMRARLAVLASGVETELREIVLRDKAEEFLAASPKGTVPVVVLPDGSVLEESLDVMDWALAQNDPTNLLGPGSKARKLVERCDAEFKPHLDRFKYAVRYENVDREKERALAAKFLQDLEERLIDQPFLFGQRISFADIGIAPFVRQFANADRPWFDAQPWPNLLLWLQTFLDSAEFAAIMPKYPKWQPSDPVTLFPEQTAP